MDVGIERLLTPRQVAELESCSITTVYDRLATGSYTAIKDGVKTLITASSIVRRRESLPLAQYGRRKGIKGIPASAPTAA